MHTNLERYWFGVKELFVGIRLEWTKHSEIFSFLIISQYYFGYLLFLPV